MTRWVRELNVRCEPSAWHWLLRRVCSVRGHRTEAIELIPDQLEITPGERRAYRLGSGPCARCASYIVIEELE